MDLHRMSFGGFNILALSFIVGSLGLTSRRQCDGPFHHGIREHVYHISSSAATTGITNKNAADTLGDIAFIFGSTGFPNPRGIAQYHEGIIEMVHVSVSSWGDYLQCNHPDGSTVYSCKCPKDHAGSCDMERAGKEQNSHSDGHVWYSFPHAGEGKYWDYEHYSEMRGCRRMAFHAQCIIDSLAYKGGCTEKCTPSNAQTCVDCVSKLNDTEKNGVWDKAIWDGGCSDLNSPEDPQNRRRQRRRRRTTSTPHYEKPPCRSDERFMYIDDMKGHVCLPPCSGRPENPKDPYDYYYIYDCPTDVPAGTTALPMCSIQDDSTGVLYCALACTAGGCPKDAKCEQDSGGAGFCVYPNSAVKYEDNMASHARVVVTPEQNSTREIVI